MIQLSSVIYFIAYILLKTMSKIFDKVKLWKTRESSKCTCWENRFFEKQDEDNSKYIKAFVQCQKHKEQFSYYCCSQSVFCCDQCEGHTSCTPDLHDSIYEGMAQNETVLCQRYMNLREYHLELSTQNAGLSNADERLECFLSKESGDRNAESIQPDIHKQLIECTMFETECLNLIKAFRFHKHHTDLPILQKTIAVLDERICKFLRGFSKFTPEKYTQKSLCVCGNTVQNAPKKGKLGAVILDTADTDITHRFVKDLVEGLKNENISVDYAGTLTGFKKDKSLPLLVVCSWDTRLEQDVKASLTRVQGYGLHRVGLLVLCLKKHHNRTSLSSDYQNPDLGYRSYIPCISGSYEISKNELNEIRLFLKEKKASGTPV